MRRIPCAALSLARPRLTLCGIFGCLIWLCDAGFMGKRSPLALSEQMDMKEVKKIFLHEVEDALGYDKPSENLERIENVLRPIFKAMPKNEQGNLEHSAVRYVLHRYFVEEHSWYYKGLEPRGKAWNASNPVSVLKDRVPTYLQHMFEKHLAGNGFSLNNIAVFAATLEHLSYEESVSHLKMAIAAHEFPNAGLRADQVDAALFTYMALFMAGGSNTKHSSADRVLAVEREVERTYPTWHETKDFVRKVRESAETNGPATYDLASVLTIADRVRDEYGHFQNVECSQMKGNLLAIEQQQSGRVLLSDFYAAALQGGEQLFTESADYLRELGALDETDPARPKVIMANYISSPANCVASSSFYSVCCVNECEGLLRHIEKKVGGPSVGAARLEEVLSQLPSASVAGGEDAPRVLSDTLRQRLQEVADASNGEVPLHGRLFAQLMHHAYPRECPYPHLSGTTNPQTPDEWLASNGLETEAASREEMQQISSTARDVEENPDRELPWESSEELVVILPTSTPEPPASSPPSLLRSAAFLLMLGSLAYVIHGYLTTALRSKRIIKYGGEAMKLSKILA
eukprot:gnl/TRDRNA2_/TRDRNA2_185934_c0_seq1.p1 gnl/TRDRNA2_/TRDRNA2_185934_c0~~gnl/TRDRNA2_/TRDRNA2_185934_c0_seq1.p1  ORF type:complete len:574 (+),score=104.85 gnl/TRDRNA2_/TRDRNA2_185934_c0_seq1:68-1789(+)